MQAEARGNDCFIYLFEENNESEKSTGNLAFLT
jgi:hypothetical protein